MRDAFKPETNLRTQLELSMAFPELGVPRAESGMASPEPLFDRRRAIECAASVMQRLSRSRPVFLAAQPNKPRPRVHYH